MIDLGSLKLGIKVDGEEAKKDLSSFGDKVKNVGSNIKDKLGSAAKVAASGVKVAAGACVAASTAIVALVESTREYREEQAKLETAFTSSGLSARVAKETFTELNGILGDSGQATEAANHLAKLCKSEIELAQWTDICAGVYGTFGDSIPIEGLTEAANETAKTGQLTGSLADALNWAGISEDEFQAKLDECSTEQERNKLITATLTDTYKEAAEQYKTTAADTIEANKANQKLQESMASFGEMLEPLTNTVKMFAAEGLQNLSEKAFPLVKQAVEWTTNNMPKIKEVISNVFKVCNSVIDAIIPVIKNLMDVIKTLVLQSQDSETKIGKVWGNIKTIIQSALKIITAALGAFSALLRGDWSALWENLKTILSAAWEAIKASVRIAITAIVSIITGTASALYNAGKSILSSLWDGLKDTWNNIKSWIEEKTSWIGNAWSKITGNGKGTKDGSHRTGLREVPYDGYMAELHKGEMILTAAEAKRYQQGINNSNDTVNNITVNNYSPKALSEAETARLYRKTQRELALGF